VNYFVGCFHHRKRSFLAFLAPPLLSFAIFGCGGIVPASEVSPEIQSTTPGNLDQGVVLNKSLSVTFSEEISPDTLTEQTFFLTEANGNPVKGKIAIAGTTATLKPLSNAGILKGGTTFVATITTQVRDLSGDPINQDHVWQFKTAVAGSPGSLDETPPEVVPAAINPVHHANGVSLRPAIILTFDEDIDAASVVMGGNFSLNHGAKGRLSFPEDGRSIIFTPTSDLDPNRKYRVEVLGGTAGIKDLSGNALAADFEWTFTTRSDRNGDL